jgi:hypothetical protein
MRIYRNLYPNFIPPFASLLIVIAFVFSSCKKSQKQFILHNHFGKVNIDIYKPGDFYKGIVYIHGTVDSNSDFAIPASKLEMGQIYYLDCYSDDYSMTNLYYDYNGGAAKMIIPKSDQMETNIQLSKSVWRPIIWNKNQLQSRWKAVDALTTGLTSIWSTLPDSVKFEEVIFNRDQIAISRYIFNQDTGSFRGGVLSNATELWDGTCKMNINAGALYNYRSNFNPKPMKDTLMLDSYGTIFVLVREQ